MRRLPSRIQHGLFIGRRWQRQIVAQLRSRWHRSLQLRVVSTTLVLSALVIAVLGFFLVQSIAEGLLTSAENSARNQVENGAGFASDQNNLHVLEPQSQFDSLITAEALTSALQKTSGSTGSYLVFIQLTTGGPVGVQWVGQRAVNITATIPPDLINAVATEQREHRSDNDYTATPWAQPTTLTYAPGLGSSGPALAVGVPIGPYYQLYYVFPLTQQQATLVLIQRILVGVGLALVVLLAAIASLVTRWVVLPVRHAAQAAQRVSAGHLEERMQVLGVDDLAALATSFNEMAASLQAKLAELEELSSVQRQFVSDVSHELRTPLSTIKMAADLLFESRQELDAAGGRSAELLQSQLERFEELLVDLLEISRYDAGAATLEADLVDVCDLVRRSADDAQQLAERKGSRIEFRLPATGCLRRGGPAPGGAHPAQHPGQRGRARRWQGRGGHRRDRQRRGGRLGPGLRRGAAPGRAAPGLRTVLAGRPGPGPHHRRHRPGPGHLAGGRAAARRLAAGLGRAGQGLGVPADPAPGRRRGPGGLAAAARPGRGRDRGSPRRRGTVPARS